jgi:hypothetical protein
MALRPTAPKGPNMTGQGIALVGKATSISRALKGRHMVCFGRLGGIAIVAPLQGLAIREMRVPRGDAPGLACFGPCGADENVEQRPLAERSPLLPQQPAASAPGACVFGSCRKHSLPREGSSFSCRCCGHRRRAAIRCVLRRAEHRHPLAPLPHRSCTSSPHFSLLTALWISRSGRCGAPSSGWRPALRRRPSPVLLWLWLRGSRGGSTSGFRTFWQRGLNRTRGPTLRGRCL